jgi:2-oxoglutarate ferredoxin oxidoreductase subunit gamma
MAMKLPLHIGLCGFGGQGIVLSSVILGTTAVTKGNLFVVQTQSYGSEARGGQCQAELILDSKPVGSPVAPAKDILICMFQDAYNKYISTLKNDGLLIVDRDLVTRQVRKTVQAFEVPATEIAVGLGNRMAANMVMLGFISESCGIVNQDALIEVVTDTVSTRFLELNKKAVAAGVSYARDADLYWKDKEGWHGSV